MIFILWLFFPLIGAWLLNASGRAGTGAALGFFLGPLGLIIAAILRLERATATPADPARLGERKCPRCAEWIKREAAVCRFCGSELATPAAKLAQCADCFADYSPDLAACPQCRSTRRQCDAAPAGPSRVDGLIRLSALLTGALVILLGLGWAARTVTDRIAVRDRRDAAVADSSLRRDINAAVKQSQR